jgi:hypothetical protein
MPDEARIIYLLLILVLMAPAGVAAVRHLFRRRDK